MPRCSKAAAAGGGGGGGPVTLDRSLLQGGGGGGGGQQLAATAGGGSGQQIGGQQKRGQEPLYKDGQKSHRFIDVTKDKTRLSGDQVHSMLSDGNTYLHINSDKNVYLGAEAGKGSFDFLVTLSGPCVNSQGKIG